MSQIEHKIEAHHRNIQQVLGKQKYTVDYFQREYSWEKKHIDQLISDLTQSFLDNYKTTDKREDGVTYNSYYLGPFVLSGAEDIRSIIDGQQRLTSLTLFLIFLHNHQKQLDLADNDREELTEMIFSKSFGKKSFNITVEERVQCLQSLYEIGSYEPKNDDDESTVNMAERYSDIVNAFPEEIDTRAFPFFIDWLLNRVVLVEIIAYSNDNAYTIFETMNDRGLSLTPTEMLKGYLLSRFKSPQERMAADKLWKESMIKLHGIQKDADQHFLQSWLRAQYADTIRAGAAGSSNEDFEKIGTRFHAWFRDRLELMGLQSNDSSGFRDFVSVKFKFFLNAYLMLRKAEKTMHEDLRHVFFAKRWGIADSLSYPLMMAPITLDDTDAVIKQKVDLVARYIEIFCVRRAVNFRKFGASSIRYTFSTMTKDIRGKSLNELTDFFSKRLQDMNETWEGVLNFSLHGQNRPFVKYFLSRISGFIDEESGQNTNFLTYYQGSGKPFEIEHIWADKFERHQDEFDQLHEFQAMRNSIGGLVLLPSGTNQSYNDQEYKSKLSHYLKENLLVKSLCEKTYDNNPNFLNMAAKLNLPFKSHQDFKIADMRERQQLYKSICEQLWSFPSNEKTEASILE